MPKRPYPDSEDINPIKKQQNSREKCRKIRSLSSERTLQLLYQGAKKHNLNERGTDTNLGCSGCSVLPASKLICNFCERDICTQCLNLCYMCNENFCSICSFNTYDENGVICYSCYV